jgi:hypothetical protein
LVLRHFSVVVSLIAGACYIFRLGQLLFERACAEGIYERDTTYPILALAEPETTYFDIGANIELLSVPVLATRPSVKGARSKLRHTHHDMDVQDCAAVRKPVQEVRPDAIVHCAGQPSHDLAASRAFEDFDVNAGAHRAFVPYLDFEIERTGIGLLLRRYREICNN